MQLHGKISKGINVQRNYFFGSVLVFLWNNNID
jgi:hypothetical protein